MDLAELKTETYDHAEHKQRNKGLKATKSTHSTRGRVEDEDDQDIHDGDSAACDQRNFDQDVQCNRSTDNLHVSVRTIKHEADNVPRRYQLR